MTVFRCIPFRWRRKVQGGFWVRYATEAERCSNLNHPYNEASRMGWWRAKAQNTIAWGINIIFVALLFVLVKSVQAALTALASISLFEETIRSEMSGSLNLLPVITTCLQHPYIGVRYGAILCLRALSRSVSVLRTSILDSGAGNCLCEIIQKPDEDPRLINIAMTGICNLVNNFSPLRKVSNKRMSLKGG